MKYMCVLLAMTILSCAGKNGINGRDGVDGNNGADGSSCSIQALTNGALISCTDGTSSLILNGERGKSCTVESMSTGTVISCEDGSTAVVLNGVDGQDGLDGTNGVDGNDGADGRDGVDAAMTAYTVVEVVDPCGHQSLFDEVMLRLNNGQLLAHYANGTTQFLTFVIPGNYVTTDGTNCYFSVDEHLNVKW